MLIRDTFSRNGVVRSVGKEVVGADAAQDFGKRWRGPEAAITQPSVRLLRGALRLLEVCSQDSCTDLAMQIANGDICALLDFARPIFSIMESVSSLA